MKREFLALGILALAVIAFPAALFGYQTWRTHAEGVRVIDLVGSSPDRGGWMPDAIRVSVGERVRLRISSPDVVHGFEIPALGVHVEEILPGHVQEVEFAATQARRYPFACTRWCSVDHWRMRGVIEVIDPSQPDAPPPTFEPPLYQQLGIDIDALHPAQNVPTGRPSVARGAQLNLNFTPDFRTQSPGDVFAQLRADSAYERYDDMQLWDAIAFAYARSAGNGSIARGAQRYARDCAACHGEAGDGTGPAGRDLPGLMAMDPSTEAHDSAGMVSGPANFTDAAQMLGANDAFLQGKVLRGGMGTGMPEWGSLYSEQDLWDVVAFLRSFTFDIVIK
ncbi:MAG: c-type cytochrome [Anaerolineae bacterium]|nr:c-type cytochrome [Anaerolineae bacterium]